MRRTAGRSSDYLQRHGRPLAVYTDHAGHFGQWLTKKEERTDTIISRALGELGVEVILAGSPQAKGRVERTFGTAQDRLIKEMRVAGISTLDAANRFLADSWVPFWNKRFVVAPQNALDEHRPLPVGIDLEALFAETETRKVARDFIIRFKNRHWQIPEQEARGVRPGDEVVVERRLCGDIHFQIGQRYLAVESLGRARPPPTPTKAQPANPENRGQSRQSPQLTIHGESKSKRVPGWPWPGGTSGPRKRPRAATDGLPSRRTPSLPSVPDGREPRSPVEAGPTWWPHTRPGKAGCDPAQRDRRQPPDLRAGQARHSDRGVHYPPHPLRSGWPGVEVTHPGEDISLYPRTFLFRLDTSEQFE